jgi:transcriptional regulator
MSAIVGIEMVIERLTGKWKVSQNHPPANRTGVIKGLTAQGTSAALDMAALVAGGRRKE